jgi:hypothetical protein
MIVDVIYGSYGSIYWSLFPRNLSIIVWTFVYIAHVFTYYDHRLFTVPLHARGIAEPHGPSKVMPMWVGDSTSTLWLSSRATKRYATYCDREQSSEDGYKCTVDRRLKG